MLIRQSDGINIKYKKILTNYLSIYGINVEKSKFKILWINFQPLKSKI